MTNDVAPENNGSQASKATLLRLANSCERLASRGSTVAPTAQDLDATDYRAIAEILRANAEKMP